MSAEQEAQARKDWELYRVLTHELIKFMDKQDIDEFLQIVDQRGVLVDRMKENPACEEYRATPECRRRPEVRWWCGRREGCCIGICRAP